MKKIILIMLCFILITILILLCLNILMLGRHKHIMESVIVQKDKTDEIEKRELKVDKDNLFYVDRTDKRNQKKGQNIEERILQSVSHYYICGFRGNQITDYD